MKQDPESRYFFTVANGEVVTITFDGSNVPATPVGDAERVFAAEGGDQLPKQVNTSHRTVEFEFIVNRPVNKSHVVSFECVFFSLFDPKSVKYSISATSDQSPGKTFTIPAANRLKPTGDLWFTVV